MYLLPVLLLPFELSPKVFIEMCASGEICRQLAPEEGGQQG